MIHSADNGEHAVAEVINASGAASLVLVCEHASCFIPHVLDNLGLTGATLKSHAAWDPGALQVARALASMLEAPLVVSGISRLVYDCNRPPEAHDAMPARSEVFDIPGNHNLSMAERQRRTEAYYYPFRNLLAETLDKNPAAALVTVHSFTPVYNGRTRNFDVGILHDTDTKLADAVLSIAGQQSRYDVRRNAPYGPEDGVTHTLKHHAIPDGRANVMIEIRNDLIATEDDQLAMAKQLSSWIADAMTSFEEIAWKG